MFGKPVATLSSALKNLIQIVKEPTPLSGSLIDHVYIHQYPLGNVNAEVKNFDVYGHDAIQISLTKYQILYISSINNFHKMLFHQMLFHRMQKQQKLSNIFHGWFFSNLIFP